MKKPNKAVLDGDIIAWKAAFVADSEGDLAIDALLRGLVDKWTPDGVDHVVVALSDKDNYRKELFPPYKSNRKDVCKPDSLIAVFETIRQSFDCLTWPTLEADDILGIMASSGEAISVSIDKDLKGVPGWLMNPDKDKEPRYITEDEADEWFHIQWMAGDSTDGVPGMWKIGAKTAEKLLNEWPKENWCENILDMYEEERYAPKDAYLKVDKPEIAMGQCVRILRDENYCIEEKEITHVWVPKVGYKKLGV